MFVVCVTKALYQPYTTYQHYIWRRSVNHQLYSSCNKCPDGEASVLAIISLAKSLGSWRALHCICATFIFVELSICVKPSVSWSSLFVLPTQGYYSNRHAYHQWLSYVCSHCVSCRHIDFIRLRPIIATPTSCSHHGQSTISVWAIPCPVRPIHPWSTLATISQAVGKHVYRFRYNWQYSEKELVIVLFGCWSIWHFLNIDCRVRWGCWCVQGSYRCPDSSLCPE